MASLSLTVAIFRPTFQSPSPQLLSTSRKNSTRSSASIPSRTAFAQKDKCRDGKRRNPPGQQTVSAGDSSISPNTMLSDLVEKAKAVGVPVLVSAILSCSGSPAAFADLNAYEANVRGEFGIGSAKQYGSADLKKTDHADENFRRANFTSADMREADFSRSNFVGSYMEKAVAYKTNFRGADFTDALMDRMVLNEADLTDAILVRTVLTRSDLGEAKIEGADFSDAILDLPQKQALCKYASGVNSVTGTSTRTSLGCSNRKGNAYGSPSSPLLSGAPQQFLTKDGFCDESTGLCKASDLN